MPRHLKNWVSAFISYARHVNEPDFLKAWSGLWCVAGALGRKCWVELGYSQLPVAQYIIAVGGFATAANTMSARIAYDLLQKANGVLTAPSSMTRRQILFYLQQMQRTTELADGSRLSHASVSLFEADLEVLMAGRDKSYAFPFMSTLADMWDGMSALIDKSQPYDKKVRLQNPSLNLISATTSEYLKAAFSRQHIHAGFGARIVWLHVKREDIDDAHVPAPEEMEFIIKTQPVLVADLEHIAAMSGPFTMTKGAAILVSELANRRNKCLQDAMYDGYQSCRDKHLCKLSAVLSAAQGDSMTIEENHVRHADRLLRETEPFRAAITRLRNTTTDVEVQRRIIELVSENSGRYVMNEMVDTMIARGYSRKMVNEALRTLTTPPAGQLEVVKRRNKPVIIRLRQG